MGRICATVGSMTIQEALTIAAIILAMELRLGLWSRGAK